MNQSWVILLYLLASVCFIQALKGLSHPTTARVGNAFGMAGMAIALVTTLAVLYGQHIASSGVLLVLSALVVGGAIGLVLARRVEMTQMPELVAAMHSLIGLSAVLIALVAALEPAAFGLGAYLPTGNRLELFLGAAIGAITFSGSVVAFGKLRGKSKLWLFRSAPVLFPHQHKLNLALIALLLLWGLGFVSNPSPNTLLLVVVLSLVLGVLIVVPIGGADMPVIVSMLNSYSGWAAAGIGFSLNNAMLIIAGSLVGSSGAILSYIMCKAMNRSFLNVVLGGFGATSAEAGGAAAEQRPVKSGAADDAAFLLAQAESVIVVPGYGLAVARAQHVLKEMAAKLTDKGISVRYAIHPVAGRMPGHMNVLLAEADIPYEQVLEMDEINPEFAETDVVLVLGANDVVNPAAKTDPTSPIAGMPILDAYRARTVMVVKRSMAAGYAGLDNDLFYLDNTMMVFGDAKKVLEDINRAL